MQDLKIQITPPALDRASMQKPDDRHDQLVDNTQKWVAQTFYGAMLKQMRESPFRSELFDGGRGGQAFGQLYDQQLAERMASSGGQKLVNSIVRRIEARTAYTAQKKSAVGKTGSSFSSPHDVNSMPSRGRKADFSQTKLNGLADPSTSQPKNAIEPRSSNDLEPTGDNVFTHTFLKAV